MKSENIEIRHLLLACAPDRHTAENDVLRFIQQNKLVRYDNVTVEMTCSAKQPEFMPMIEQGTQGNQAASKKMLTELMSEGYSSVLDLATLPQGYLSKLLHTVAHLQDGFFGIDSALYNLVEDSHQVSTRLSREMEQRPGEFWAVKVRCVYFHHEDASEWLRKRLT